MKIVQLMICTVILSAPLSVFSAQDEAPPEVSVDGMAEIEKTRRKAIYADPGVDWTIYEKVRLDTATVAFRKNWLRDQNRGQPHRIREDDMERIRETMARTFDEVFTKELSEKGGYELAENNGENVLRITPQIVDLDVYAPDPRSAPGIQRVYAETAGRMTLKLHFYDSVTGDLIATASENRESPRRGYMQWSNSVSNTAEARRMFQSWAKALRERLDQATEGGSLTK